MAMSKCTLHGSFAGVSVCPVCAGGSTSLPPADLACPLHGRMRPRINADGEADIGWICDRCEADAKARLEELAAYYKSYREDRLDLSIRAFVAATVRLIENQHDSRLCWRKNFESAVRSLLLEVRR